MHVHFDGRAELYAWHHCEREACPCYESMENVITFVLFQLGKPMKSARAVTQILSASNSSSGVEFRIYKSHYFTRSFVFVV